MDDDDIKFWHCKEIPGLPDLRIFIDQQVGRALKDYTENLDLLIDGQEGDVVVTAIIAEDGEGGSIKKRFSLSDELLREAVPLLEDGSMHPETLQTQVIGVAATLRQIADKLDERAAEIRKANAASGREWK